MYLTVLLIKKDLYVIIKGNLQASRPDEEFIFLNLEIKPPYFIHIFVFRLKRDMERYGNLSKKIVTDIGKGKHSTVNVDKPNTRSVVDLIVSIYRFLVNIKVALSFPINKFHKQIF